MILEAVKKPVKIKCVQWTGENFSEIQEFCGKDKDGDFIAFLEKNDQPGADFKLVIKTLEGNHTAIISDYIIRGVKGEFYPCKDDIFLQTYDLLTSQVRIG